MKTEYVRGLKKSLEWWIEFNSDSKGKANLQLLDVSKLLAIIRRYYVMYPKKETLKN